MRRYGPCDTLTYALSRFMRLMFFLASRSLRYSLSLSYAVLRLGAMLDGGRGTYQLDLLDFLFQLFVFRLILDIVRATGDGSGERFCALLCGRGGGLLEIHLVVVQGRRSRRRLARHGGGG